MENKELELNLEELGLESLEVSTDTMLEEMGASIGLGGCCSSIIVKN